MYGSGVQEKKGATKGKLMLRGTRADAHPECGAAGGDPLVLPYCRRTRWDQAREGVYGYWICDESGCIWILDMGWIRVYIDIGYGMDQDVYGY